MKKISTTRALAKIPLEDMASLFHQFAGNRAAVAKHLGITYDAFQHHIKSNKELQEIIKIQDSINLDTAEETLQKMIKGWDEEIVYIGHYKGKIVEKRYKRKRRPSEFLLWSYLKTKGKERGYMDLPNAGNQVTVDTINFVTAEPKLKITPDEEATIEE
jgi:hypothetical protein